MDASIKVACSSTSWIFLSYSDERRHLLDIVFATLVLLKRGVDISNIYIFSSDPNAAGILSGLDNSNVYKLDQFDSVLASISYTHAFVTITGHGSPNGVGQNMRSADLSKGVRSIQNLEIGVLALCQCFAGVFNFSEAYSDPKLVVMGATNLSLSISSTVSVSTGIPGVDPLTWCSNLFMMHFFDWMRQPIDIDGDGHLTVLDAYKYAGAFAHDRVSKAKSEVFVEIQDLSAKLTQQRAHKATLEQAGLETLAVELDISSILTLMDNKLSVLHTSQEPWLLNANLSRKVELIL